MKCPKCGKDLVETESEVFCPTPECEKTMGPALIGPVLLARVRELEGKLATARLEFQNIVEQWVFRSEIFPTEEQCAATLADFARKALEKIGGKS